MTAVPNQRLLHKAVVAMLTAATTKPAALARVPDNLTFDDDGLLIDPYSIVYPLVTTQITGSWIGPGEHVCIPFQVTAVGRNDEQAQAMADLNREAVLARTAGGSFVNPITADVQVIERRIVDMSGPDPAGGGLWQVPDTFELEVTV